MEVKNSIGNGEAKEFRCTTYGHELGGGGVLVLEVLGMKEWRYWAEVDKGKKKWENCNSIINKIYYKK